MSNQLTVKTNYKGDIRKIRVESGRYNWLRKSIIKTYSLDEVNFKLVYVDEDEDKITIGNMNDLNLALESVPTGKLLKIFVKVLKDSPQKQEPKKEVVIEQPKEGEKLLPLMKLQEPKPQPKENKDQLEKKEEGEKLLPLMKLQKPKPQPKQAEGEQPKEGEKLLPLMKLQKPKPQPKQVEVEQPKEGEKLLPLMKLQKPKPQPKQVEVEQSKEGEKLLPLMKLQKPKPQPKEKKVVKKEKIPIVFSNNENVEQPQPEFPFTQALNDLVMMGFADNTQLRSLLVSNKGDMEATVNQLLN